MLKRLFVFILVLTFGINIASAQQPDTSDTSCDPYQLGESTFSVSPDDLNAPPQDTVSAFAMREIGINPHVLFDLADNMTGSPAHISALADPATRLEPQYYALVTRDDAPLDVHYGICVDSTILAHLPRGTRVTVLDGPIDSDGFAWWRVRRDDLTGWVVEGEDGDIWLTGIR